MRAVVTGGAGFLGSHLCDRLLAEGWDVLAVDNFITGAKGNLSHLEDNKKFKFQKADVSKPLKVQIERTGTMKALNGKAIAGFTTTFTVKRKDFGMKFMLGPLGDEVLLIVSLECAAP